MTEAVIALADGRVFPGRSIGALGTSVGEVVFTTSMSGYQEILSDPSFRDQIVTMSATEIGNVGVNAEDMESDRIQASGLVVRSARPRPSNYRAERSLADWLVAGGVVAIEDVDTRALVLHLRRHGAQMGVISTEVSDVPGLVARAKAAPSMAGRDLAQVVSTRASYAFDERPSALQRVVERELPPGPRIVVVDFGVKRSILRRLTEVGARVTVVPATTTADDLVALRPDGIVLSNGPGDPEPLAYAIATARRLVGRVPVLGICLGHQILGLAYGGRSYKLLFGHRGSNQPVQDLASGRVMVTAQNHGFAIDPESLGASVRVSELNLNDQTLEAFEVERDRVVAVQYHPEASPGPHDASGHFERFLGMVRAGLA